MCVSSCPRVEVALGEPGDPQAVDGALANGDGGLPHRRGYGRRLGGVRSHRRHYRHSQHRRGVPLSIAADYMIEHSDNSGAGEESASRPTHDEGFFPFFSR